jgi:hypothetical protein
MVEVEGISNIRVLMRRDEIRSLYDPKRAFGEPSKGKDGLY